jgi:hypothetical protein
LSLIQTVSTIDDAAKNRASTRLFDRPDSGEAASGVDGPNSPERAGRF